MCTAITLQEDEFYFGRNMDIAYSFGERIVITPRNYKILYKELQECGSHYGIVGMANVSDGYPLYADAINEKGLGMAGLNFPGYAKYNVEKVAERKNVAPYELILYILGNCSNIEEARMALSEVNLLAVPFSIELPLAPLHWIVADKSGSLTVEQTKEGMKIWENPVGVLTNNPTFDFHMTNLSNYVSCSPYEPDNYLYPNIILPRLSHGMGGRGLPGDVSSCSRFVRATFAKGNAILEPGEANMIAQFFHILDTASVSKGQVRLEDNRPDYTRYSCCANGDRGIYYYKTYDGMTVNAVSLCHHDLERTSLIEYELKTEMKIQYHEIAEGKFE